MTTQCSVRAYNTATVAVAASTDVIIPLNSERWDTHGMHDNAINNSRLTCTVPGTYFIWGSLDWGTGSPYDSWRATAHKLNGTTIISYHSAVPGNDGTVVEASTIYRLGLGDYVELMGRSGVVETVQVSAQFSPEAGMQLIGETGFDYGARVYRASNQSIPLHVWTAVSFSNARWDTNSFWNIGSPSVLTINKKGRYLVTAHCQMANDMSMAVGLLFNHSTYIQIGRTTGGYRCGVSDVYEFDVGDYVEMMIWNDWIGAVNLNTYANFSPEFSIQMISEVE
jgi:hypothetical protein